jgi:mevalonate kinase
MIESGLTRNSKILPVSQHSRAYAFKFPTKTFLLGEYLALLGGPAIVLTTTPYFHFQLMDLDPVHNVVEKGEQLQKSPLFHPLSPAGKFLAQHPLLQPYQFTDPYSGIGGLGASSAEFLAACYGYYASTKHPLPGPIEICDIYQTYIDTPASGYDVLAQTQPPGCVFIHKEKAILEHCDWPFEDIGYILVHTQRKLKTHEHLRDFRTPDNIETLLPIVQNAYHACKTGDAPQFIRAIQGYHEGLDALGLIAEHTHMLIKDILSYPHVQAAKGCGAMGADTICILASAQHISTLAQQLHDRGMRILNISN